MTILSDTDILKAIADGQIVIDPFDKACLGSNSYDVHLSDKFAIVGHNDSAPSGLGWETIRGIDTKRPTTFFEGTMSDSGQWLFPGNLCLGSTVEYTETLAHVPFLEGKSSLGRLGVAIHCTAGRGDVGFKNHWTLEITVVYPTKVYPRMPIGQLFYFETGSVGMPYDKKPSAKYTMRDEKPQASQYWRNFIDD